MPEHTLQDLEASALPDALDRQVEAAAAGTTARRTLHVERRGDDVLDATVLVEPPGKPAVSIRMAGLDRPRVRSVVAWARSRDVGVRASFEQWPAWAAATLDERARALAAVFDLAPLRVEVSRGKPMTERGEAPTGQPSIVIDVGDADFAIQAYLDLQYTGESDHAAVEADFIARAQALAAAYRIACVVV